MDFKRFGGSEAVGMGVLTRSKFTLLLAAVEFRFPRMKGRLCRVRAALKGLDHARQPRHAVPMISNVRSWMCIHFCGRGVPRLGFGIVIQGKSGMGPSEMLGVGAGDVTLPEDWGYPLGSGPVDIGLGLRAMTKAKRPQVVSFLEELEPGLAEGLRILRRHTPKGQRLFPCSLAQYRALIETVQASFNLDFGAPSGIKAALRKGAAAQAKGEGVESGSEAGSWLEVGSRGASSARAPAAPAQNRADTPPPRTPGGLAMGANVSTSAAKHVSAVADGSIGLVEAAWRGVDLLDVHAQGSTGRFFVEDEDDWPAFPQEPEVQQVMQLEPEFSDELERLLLFSSAARPRGEFTHSAFRSPKMYQSASFWARWLPSGHVGIAWGVVAIRFRPQWANPARGLLGMGETAEAPAMAEQLKVPAESCFPAPELDLGPEALRGAPALPGGSTRRLSRRVRRAVARVVQFLFPFRRREQPRLLESDRTANTGDGYTMNGTGLSLTVEEPLAGAGGGGRS
ncbi:unnamed protein product [Prorocentrum cordatum]|uniref:Uncharacterized protein n=1 Tax=Prorocentrum cordatum TaxID=2364126 RepID=A0ABN9Y5M2_9DINO|nr:unnamed protein product [Polarella glacialis]